MSSSVQKWLSLQVLHNKDREEVKTKTLFALFSVLFIF